MSWKSYRLTLRLLSPLHIGLQKIGNIQHCRRYLSGRALWGALTARLTRDFFTPTSAEYNKIGERVNSELAFSYFYPALNDGLEVWLPWGQTNLEEFDWQFLGTYASTALADGHRALDASLHETEFIAPRTRDNRQVYLTGYVFERQGTDLPWHEVLNRMQLGSERRYGWGRVAVHGKLDECDDCLGFVLKLDQSRPEIYLPGNGHLPAHTLVQDENVTDNFAGQLEPFFGRVWKATKQNDKDQDEEIGTGHGFSPVAICWAPGTHAKSSDWFQIGEYGVLNLKRK